MSTRHEESRQSPPNDDPAYRFHLQDRNAALRQSSRRHRTFRESTQRNPTHQLFLNNLKTFVIVAAGMFLMLVVSFFYLKKSWQMMNRKLVQENKSAAVSSIQPPRRTTAGGGIFDTNSAVVESERLEQAMLIAHRGDALFVSENLKEAAAAYNEALEIWPKLSKVRRNLGRVYLQMGDFGRAQVALEKASSDNPASPEIVNDLAVVAYRQRRHDKAIELLESALALDPNFSIAHFNLSLCHSSRGAAFQAAEHLDAYLAIHPNDPHGLRQKAFLQAAGGEMQDALDILTSAISTTPDWPPLYFDAAAAAALLGQNDLALRYLSQVESIETPVGVYLVYQQPAFQSIRETAKGKAYDNELRERARRDHRALAAPRTSRNIEPLLSPIESESAPPVEPETEALVAEDVPE